MAFVNARLTKEEKAEIEARAIPNPGNPCFTLRPSIWTIDHQENVILIWGLREREEPYDYHFILMWKGTPLPVKLREYWDKGLPRKWELISLKITENLIEKQFEILQSLKDALTVYGLNGSPDAPFDNINKNIKVEFNF